LIHESELEEAIAACQGERHPTANTCYKLAAFLFLKRELFDNRIPESSYSFDAGPVNAQIEYKSGTIFSQAIHGKREEDVWPIIDELFSAVRVINPRLHDEYIRKLRR